MLRVNLAASLALVLGCGASRPPSAIGVVGPPRQPAVASPTGSLAAPTASSPAPLRLTVTDAGCVMREERTVIAPPCTLDPTTHDVTCLVPDAAMPRFVPLDPRRDLPPAGFTLSLIGPARDLATSPTQVCIVLGDGSVSCARPGHPRRTLEDLPPMTAIALGEGCGEILCGVSEEHELVCVATAARVGSVRVPAVSAVSVTGCTVCMAALDGRLACFGEPSDTAPFASAPRLVPDRVCTAPDV